MFVQLDTRHNSWDRWHITDDRLCEESLRIWSVSQRRGILMLQWLQAYYTSSYFQFVGGGPYVQTWNMKEYKYPSSLTNIFLYLWILYAVLVGVVWVTREEELTCLYCWVNFVLCCVTPWRGAEPPVKYKQCSGTECTARPDGRSINYELYFTYLSW